MDLAALLKSAVDMGASDIFIIPGAGVIAKIKGEMKPLSADRLMTSDTEALVHRMYELAHRDYEILEREGDDDFSFAILDVSRFRCNAYRQRGSVAAVCRIVNFELPDPRAMNIPGEEYAIRALDHRNEDLIV